jgi:hypothetical protein
LRAGLCSELLDRLVTVDELEDWYDFIALCKKVDRKLRALGQGNKNTNLNRMTSIFSGPKVPTAQSTTTTAMGTHPGPIDLSASKRYLMDEEWATQIWEGHCLYCGGLGHLARECSNKPSRRTTIAAAIATAQVSNTPTIVEPHSEN